MNEACVVLTNIAPDGEHDVHISTPNESIYAVAHVENKEPCDNRQCWYIPRLQVPRKWDQNKSRSNERRGCKCRDHARTDEGGLCEKESGDSLSVEDDPRNE